MERIAGQIKGPSWFAKNWHWFAIGALAFLCFIFWHANDVFVSQNKALMHQVDSAFTIARQYKGENGELIQQVTVHELTIRDLKKIGNNLGFDLGKKEKEIGNLKNLVGYWKGQAGFAGKDTVKLRDTVYLHRSSAGVNIAVNAKNFKWDNKYLFLSGDYYPADNELAFEYSYDLGGFELTAYRKKLNGFWKPKSLVADVKFGDQNINVTAFQGVVIKEEKKGLLQRPAFWGVVGFLGGVLLAK